MATTKRDAGLQLLALAREIAEHSGGDEEAEVWILRLLWLADDLGGPTVRHHPWYENLILREPTPSRRVKLRRLIDHPSTGEHERAAALAALARL